MTARGRIIVGIAVVAATSGLTLGAGIADAQPPPEVRLTLVGLDQVGLYHQTYGRLGCRLIAGVGGLESPSPPVAAAGYRVDPAPPFSIRFQARCPDGTRSPWARLYGPRNPINDARTMFNGATMDLFGV